MSKQASNLIRYAIYALGLNPLYNYLRLKLGKNVSHLYVEETRRFDAIYERGVWLGQQGGQSLSGPGSDLASTETLRSQLPNMLTQLKVKTLLDIGCGDWSWMRLVPLPCDYVGVDIVASIIERNQNEYGSERVRFLTLNAVKEALPRSDAALCREVLFHLSFSDAKSMILNIAKSGASHLIATCDNDVPRNFDIVTGDFRSLNLRLRPFGFPEPLMQLQDNSVSSDRSLCVWPMDEVIRSMN